MNRPLTDEERVAVTERFYRRCYRATVFSAMALCGVAVLVAYANAGEFPWVAACACTLLAAGEAILCGERGYLLLRRRPAFLRPRPLAGSFGLDSPRHYHW